jgi:hypothetical protein
VRSLRQAADYAPNAATTVGLSQMKTKHPIQPVELDKHGVIRFKQNAIVRYLLDAGPFDLNQLALMPFSREDREQFAQLIGYSVSGFSELDYVSDKVFSEADLQAEKLRRR